MKIEIHDGDVVFKRAYNGWIIQKVLECESECVETYVIEDSESDSVEALWCAFQEACIDESR